MTEQVGSAIDHISWLLTRRSRISRVTRCACCIIHRRITATHLRLTGRVLYLIARLRLHLKLLLYLVNALGQQMEILLLVLRLLVHFALGFDRVADQIGQARVLVDIVVLSREDRLDDLLDQVLAHLVRDVLMPGLVNGRLLRLLPYIQWRWLLLLLLLLLLSGLLIVCHWVCHIGVGVGVEVLSRRVGQRSVGLCQVHGACHTVCGVGIGVGIGGGGVGGAVGRVGVGVRSVVVGAQRVADGAVGLVAVLPVGDDLARGGAVGLAAIPSLVALGHVGEHVAHGAAVRHIALSVRALRALVRVQQEHELLLDQLPLLLLVHCAYVRIVLALLFNHYDKK